MVGVIRHWRVPLRFEAGSRESPICFDFVWCSPETVIGVVRGLKSTRLISTAPAVCTDSEDGEEGTFRTWATPVGQRVQAGEISTKIAKHHHI